MDIVSIFLLIMLACLAGYYAVRLSGSSSHMPVIAAIGGIGAIIIIGALIVSAEASNVGAHYLGLVGVVLGSASAFGGFGLAERMLAKERK